MGELSPPQKVSLRDIAVVAGALGRSPYQPSAVPVRCPFGYPAIVETPPLVGDGSPNPTLLYLVCPALAKAVSQAESAGAVRRLRELARSRPETAETMAEVDRRYRARRVALLEAMTGQGSAGGAGGAPAAPGGARAPNRVMWRAGAARLRESGVGGQARAHVASCLHAHAAAWLAVLYGWLRGEEEAEDSLAESVQMLWALFLPPPDECWCKDKLCKQWDRG